jgi:hypothetical protein
MNILKNKLKDKRRFDEDLDEKYNIHDVDHPNGWNISELEILKEMGFEFDDDDKSTDLVCTVEIVGIRENGMESKRNEVACYKCNEGYVLIPEDGRRYVFDKFNSMMNYIERN